MMRRRLLCAGLGGGDEEGSDDARQQLRCAEHRVLVALDEQVSREWR
jgi:hypothetical protein